MKFEKYFKAIEKKYSKLKSESARESLKAHLKSIFLWNKKTMYYPVTSGVDFPNSIHIAHAVCHPKCGVQEFIVEGTTQSANDVVAFCLELKYLSILQKP